MVDVACRLVTNRCGTLTAVRFGAPVCVDSAAKRVTLGLTAGYLEMHPAVGATESGIRAHIAKSLGSLNGGTGAGILRNLANILLDS